MKQKLNRLTASMIAMVMTAALMPQQGVSANKKGNATADLSALTYELDAEYYYDVYNRRAQQEGEPQVFKNKDIVIRSLTYDQLPYLLQQEGNYLILFGGVWSKQVRQAIPYINEYAKAYGISEVYNFDFRLDGESEATDVENLTNKTRNPYGKLVTADEYNYLYGEIVERYLTNLDEWTAETSESAKAVTWRHVSGQVSSRVARLQVPFLFLYNKDNAGRPIAFAIEGFGDNYSQDVRRLFHYIFERKLKISAYTDSQYFADALIENNNRGHAPKLYDIFNRDEQTNLNAVNYHQLRWLLSQPGDAVVLIAGAWCANSTAAFGPISDYAVTNQTQVYVFDDRLDGKYPIDFWGYGRDRQFKSRDTRIPGREGELNPNAYLYVDLVREQLPNMEVTGHGGPIYYLNAQGDTVKAPASQSPYLLAYNKDAGHIVAWYEKMLEVNEKSLRREQYLYTPENYREYTDGVRRVLTVYTQRTGRPAVSDPATTRRPLIDFDYIYEPPRQPRGQRPQQQSAKSTPKSWAIALPQQENACTPESSQP